MSADYSDVYRHLAAYRHKLNKTQKEMGDMLNVQQSQYQKLEQGNVILTYRNLSVFEARGGDLLYLFTGRSSEPGPFAPFFARCRTDAEQKQLYRQVVWMMEQEARSGRLGDAMVTGRSYSSMKLWSQPAKLKQWQRIRGGEYLTQQNMADLLDISLKRYKKIERDEAMPNGGILYSLYCQLGYSPAVVMQKQLYDLDEVNQLWELVPGEDRIRLEHFLEQATNLVIGSQESNKNETVN